MHHILSGIEIAIDGSEILTSEITGTSENAEKIGHTLAQQLLAKGADKILRQVYDEQ